MAAWTGNGNASGGGGGGGPSVTESPEADLLSVIAWNGTPPSTPAALRYRWYKIGKLVTVSMRLVYDVAGTTNTQVDIDLPADVPAPVDFAGQANDEAVLAVNGLIYASPAGTAFATRSWMLKSGSVYRIRNAVGAVSARAIVLTATYRSAT